MGSILSGFVAICSSVRKEVGLDQEYEPGGEYEHLTDTNFLDIQNGVLTIQEYAEVC